MPLQPWQHLGEERLVRFKVFDVARCRRRSPRTGAEIDMFTIRTLDWVHIVPVTTDGRFVLVRQYRHGSCAFSVELPGGAISEPGESPEQAAVRELLEETGYAPRRMLSLGSVNPNPALFGNRCYTFLAEDCDRVAEPQLDLGEDLEVLTVTRGELDALVRRGEVDHALVCAGMYLYDLRARG